MHRTVLAAPLAAALASQADLASAGTMLFGSDLGSGGDPSALYGVDPTTGAATRIGSIGFDFVDSLAFSPDGTLYGAGLAPGTNDNVLLTIDPVTGAGTQVTSLDRDVFSLSFIGDTLYGVNSQEDLATIDILTGSFTEISFIGDGTLGLASDSDGDLFAIQIDELFTVDPATGATGPQTDLGDFNLRNATFAPDDTLFATDLGSRFISGDESTLVTVDPANGDVTVVGNLGADLAGLAAAPAGFGVVPLPMAGWLLLGGVGALAAVGRRRESA